MNFFELSISRLQSGIIPGLLLGIFVSVFSYTLIQLIIVWFSKRKEIITENNYVITILLEIKRAIERGEEYIRLLHKDKISFSKIYTNSYDKSLVELIKINSNPLIIDKLNYIYSIFFFANFNIDRGRYHAGVGFISDHLTKIYSNYNQLIDIVRNRRNNFNFLIFNYKIPKELEKIKKKKLKKK